MSGDSVIISGKWWEIGRISPGEWERAKPALPAPNFLSMKEFNHQDTKNTKFSPSSYLDHLAYSVIHTAQLISYLRASHWKLGLLINFNVPLLKQGIRRVIY